MTRPSVFSRSPRNVALLAAALLGVVHTAAAQPDLTPVFGDSASAWSFADKRGKPGGVALQPRGERMVLQSTVAALTGQCTVEHAVGSEVVAVLRLVNEGVNVRFAMTGGLDGSANATNGLVVSLAARLDTDAATATLQKVGQGPREYLAQRSFAARWITDRGLGLPEDIRRQVEHQIASLPHLRERWLHVRWQIRADGTRVYVDDRLLWEGEPTSAGRFRVDLTPGVELANWQVRPLAADQPGFETLALTGYLNASKLDDAALKRDSLPAADTAVDVGGIPFLLPQPDARGNDHVDIGPSWLQSGFLGSRDSPRAGTFGGRWTGAWSLNPSRIQFTLPAGRYSAIHLLAAADSAADSVPFVTAQFYIPSAGRPVQIRSATVSRFDAPAGPSPLLPATLANGKAGNLYLVTIPIEPGDLACFGAAMELELAKEVRLYRAWPDPMYYSFHAAGLPSAVHVYGMTLQRPPVALDLQAENGLHVWTAPDKPTYTATLRADRPLQSPVTLELTTTSEDGAETLRQTQAIALQPDRAGQVRFELAPRRYGYHALQLALKVGDQTIQTEKRSFVLLHADTRERGGWERGLGPLFGFWNWRGGHGTPPEPIPMRLMAMAGAECAPGSFEAKSNPDAKEVARRHGIKSYKAFGAGDHYITARFAGELETVGRIGATSNFLNTLAARHVKPDDLNRPLFISFYAEPGIGIHTHGVPLSYDGFSETNDFIFSEAEEKRFQWFLNGFIEGARLVKKHYPGVKCLLPHGDPTFAAPFLLRSKEARELIDGVTVDIPVFEKLPEYQMHQVSLHRLYIARDAFRKAGHPNPWLPMYEGPCLPTRPGSLTPAEHAALSVRNSLILLAYGVDIQTGGWSPFDAGSYWGEQHYGGGSCDPLPLATPRASFAAYATMTRHLNRRNFDTWLPTGSLSTYALQFAHHQNGSRVHVFWTIRGKRPVTVAVPAGAAVTVFDAMDNATELPVRDGSVTFTVGQAPCYVAGLPAAPGIALGEADHADAVPAQDALRLANLGDGTWTLSAERDLQYEESFKDFIRRYPTAMRVATVGADADKGGSALAVHLEKPASECRTMPYYTTLVPANPIEIPGKGSHLGLWVKGASDWGRVVYALRDAKGERWLSVGKQGAWNCDDIHAWSYFNFDGWRYLRFELPACSPYDGYREAGSTWWGAYGPGDSVPDLPLKLEKILVERRTHAMYVNDPQPASTNDVLLAGLDVEYEKPEDRTPEAVRLSALRMPVPSGEAEMGNPILKMQAVGVGEPVEITGIEVPMQESDGTQCNVVFTTMAEASSYEIWASPYPDGRGAVQMARSIAASPRRVRGFRPDMDFYLYVTYTGVNKKPSKPSKPFKIRLKDTFAMK